MRYPLIFIFLLEILHGCVPKESVVLRAVNIKEVETGADGNAILKADVVFHNPNSSRMRLKEIDVEIFVDGKKAASVDQKLSALIKANSEFTVPLSVQLNLKEMGLFETILSFLGSKRHEIRFTGSLKLKVNGFAFRVPVNSQQSFSF